MAPAGGAQLGGLLAEQFWGLSHTCQPRRFQQRCSKAVLPFSLCSAAASPGVGCHVLRDPCPGGQPGPGLGNSSSSKELCL